MGTDIHTYVERWNPELNRWVVPTVSNTYYQAPVKRLELARGYRQSQPPYDQLPYQQRPLLTEEQAQALAQDDREWDGAELVSETGFSERNYGLFAILADVRNGRGFAGDKIGEPTVPISAPRGIPADASEGYASEVDDGHSHTWYLLSELLDYDWDGHYSVNSLLAHPRSPWARAHGEPMPPLPEGFDFDDWAQTLELVLNVEGEEAAYQRWPCMGFCSGISGGDAHEWRRVAWRVTHRHQAGEEWFQWLDKLKAEADQEGRPYDQVRICMFFDS